MMAMLCAGPLRTVIPVSRGAQIGGDAMAGGNFNDVLEFDEQGNVSAHGPLKLDEGEELSKFYVCIFQTRDDRTGAVAMGVEDGANAREGDAKWRTRADAIHEGQLREGPAIGMALAILKKDESTVLYPWLAYIYLKLQGSSDW